MSIAWVRATATGFGQLRGKRHKITEPTPCRVRIVRDSGGEDFAIVLDRDIHMPIIKFSRDPEVEFVTDKGVQFYTMIVGYRGQPCLPGQHLDVVRE